MRRLVLLLLAAACVAAEPDVAQLRALIREELKAEARPPLESFVRNGFQAETDDKAFAFHFGGRLEWDNAWFTQDDDLLIGPSPGVRYQDGTAFRRARLRADGTVYGNIDFVTEVNFANIQDVPSVNNDTVSVGSVGLTQFHVTFREVPAVGNVRLGHFVGPFGLERYSSSRYLYYMERSSLWDAFFSPNQFQSGVQVFDSYLDDRLTLNAAVTRVGGRNLNNFGFEAQDGLYAAGVRVTGLPVDAGETLLHVGANAYHQALSRNQFAAASRLPLRAGGGPTEVPNLVATGTFFTPDGASILDAELAFVHGPFSLSAEVAAAGGGRAFTSYDGGVFTGPRGRVWYSAGYVEAGCFLTPGDHRSYDRKTGTWARTVPVRNALPGPGAVQVVARLAHLDLVSGDPPLTPTSGGARAGRQTDVTLGLNWYLNPQTFIMVNYVWAHVDSIVPGASGDVHAVGTRLHFDF